jgi:predicted  nucleic acid-binding Zn-ribbon protein
MSLSGNLAELADLVAMLEKVNETAQDEVKRLRGQLDDARRRITELEVELAHAVEADEICDLIADVRRGIYTIDELYAGTIG